MQTISNRRKRALIEQLFVNPTGERKQRVAPRPRRTELESKLEDRCVDRIKALGGEALKLVLLGLMGWPDRTCLLPGGIIFFVEFKRQRTGRVRTQQKWWADRLGDLGFRVYVVDDDEKFERILARELAA